MHEADPWESAGNEGTKKLFGETAPRPNPAGRHHLHPRHHREGGHEGMWLHVFPLWLKCSTESQKHF